ncbi:MAG: N-acetylglucosamine-6-phosphate deacetylase [Erysipelotrichaceae bacterium]|nr:MAG: N-acetylglucosamine-6-phosphate [Erysipelotrichaceae bacterium]TXT19130.1 MAG: N-acetylglucosamine-6-phosphate deacetylase [Erysipelotrichaceae bacterium]
MGRIIHYASMIVTGCGPTIKNAALVEEDGKIVLVTTADDPKVKGWGNDSNVQHIYHKRFTLIPGFIDQHTHGALGFDFISVNQDNLREIATFYAQEGSTSFLTSLMTLPHDQELEILSTYSSLKPCIDGARWIGIHDEGPFISLKYKAMMDPLGIRPININELEENIKACGGKLKMVTVAPELEGIEAFIKTCARFKIAVMFAHSDATAKQTLHALHEGGDGFTHLYNAMTQHTHRNPGMVTAALIEGNSYCELIVDGFHVDPLVIKMTYEKIGSKRIIGVTDGNPAKGLGDIEFEFGGVKCISKNGRALTKETQRIAGSTVGMIDVFRNLMTFTGCSIEEVVEMCSVNPAHLLKLTDIGLLKPGYKADFIVLDEQYQVLSTYRDGRCVYNAPGNK